MTVDFIGMIAPQEYSETRPPAGPPVDDAVDCGRLVPLVREQIAQREQQASPV